MFWSQPRRSVCVCDSHYTSTHRTASYLLHPSGRLGFFPSSRSLLHLYSPQNNKSIFFWGEETTSKNDFAHLKQRRGGVAEGVEGRDGGGLAEDEMRRRKSRGKLKVIPKKINRKNKVEREESGGSLAFADPWLRPSRLSQMCLRLLIRIALGGTNSRSAFRKRPGQKCVSKAFDSLLISDNCGIFKA